MKKEFLMQHAVYNYNEKRRVDLEHLIQIIRI